MALRLAQTWSGAPDALEVLGQWSVATKSESPSVILERYLLPAVEAYVLSLLRFIHCRVAHARSGGSGGSIVGFVLSSVWSRAWLQTLHSPCTGQSALVLCNLLQAVISRL